MPKTIEQPRSAQLYALRAVIDIGATSIRMVVAQLNHDGSFHVLDALSQNVAIGSDTFARGQIAPATINACIKVLRCFATVLNQYRIDMRTAVRAVATSAVREACNRNEFLDRIYIATGIAVEVIDGAEVNRLAFLSIQRLLEHNQFLKQGQLLVAEVGGGSTELLALVDGRVAFAHTYQMGSLRLRKALDALAYTNARQVELAEAEIAAIARKLGDAAGKNLGKAGRKLLLMGGEARFAAHRLLTDWDEATLAQLKVADLVKLSNQTLGMDVEHLVQHYRLSIEEAKTLGPTLRIYVRVAKILHLRQVCVCSMTLRDGLMEEAAFGNAWTDDFVAQILHSAAEISRRYHNNKAHADCVTQHALTIFRALQAEHQLDQHYEVILTVAAMLHDVGTFVAASGHHKHGQYLIENSEIFGMGREDILLTALVVRYHRRAKPGTGASHQSYNTLGREKRLAVSKLAAILRVADALDRCHSQALRDIRIELQDDKLIVEVCGSAEITPAKRALAEKSKMLESIYGRSVVLRTRHKG